MSKQACNLNREMETKKQIDVLELKTKLTEMNISLHAWLNSRFKMAEYRVSILECRSIEIINSAGTEPKFTAYIMKIPHICNQSFIGYPKFQNYQISPQFGNFVSLFPVLHTY